MNGDVNGTMEEPKEVSLPNAEVNKPEPKVTSEVCDDNKIHCEKNTETDNYHIDSELKNGNSENSQANCLEDEHSQDYNDKLAVECPIDCAEQVSAQELGYSAIQNRCENSNDSYPDSSSSPAQSETSKEQETTNLNLETDHDLIHVQDEVSSADEASVISGERRAEDTVSIDSDLSCEDRAETSQESQFANKINNVIILDNDKSEVHEIVSDNECSVESENKSNPKQIEKKTQLRRSSRTIKRKKYVDDIENGDESDIEEIELGDPLKRKSRPIVINDTKALVAMAVKNMKSYANNQKKEPTVVIIDTNSASGKSVTTQNTKLSNSLTAQNLYQSIVARGTTVTPISSKNIASPQVTQNAQPNILPSLTDDMFVVEAPSFIVPYVYEKPSVKPFREFVDKLGKDLEEVRTKEEEKEKVKREKEKQARRANGETVASDDETHEEEQKAAEPGDVVDDNEKKKKKSKKEQQRRRNEEDDVSWDGESLSETDDEVLSDEDDKIVVKDKSESIDQIKDMATLTADKICSNKSSGLSSMDCSLGKFFINIGLNLVQEYVQTDLLKQQNRKLYKEKKAGHSTKATEGSISQLMKNLELSKENNAPYRLPINKCQFCSFRSESKLVLQQHLETPHMKNNVYKCNFCKFEIRSAHDILYHMEAEHNIRGKLERAPSYHQCTNCTFEDNGKGKLARHLIACAKKFKPDSNLAPPIDWEPPAKIPKIAKPRNSMMGSYQSTMNRGQMGANIRTPINVSGMMPGLTGYRPRGGLPIAPATRTPNAHNPRILRGAGIVRHASPAPLILPNNLVSNNAKPKSVHQPSISITPLPRQPQPNPQPQPPHGNSKNQFVICEICDGYIKDLEQLRNHMQWIHKVKIHPKMIYNRPPLNCQKCQFRFFTDQGLERHLLGSHGLVTSSMQEAANKGKDAGRCPVCGRVYQWKLLNHVARDHNLTLKPAHLSYKCTVCTATFGMYKQFENHVYSAHSVVAKRVMDKSKGNGPPSKANDTLLKPLKINDEITIIPQPVKSTSAKEK